MRGLILFLNAGDPCFPKLEEAVLALDQAGVAWLELAVPFPNSVTDGPTIHRSAERALANGTDLDATLAFVARIKPRLQRLKIALLADWRHTVRAQEPDDFLRRLDAFDGLLLHGVPPRIRPRFYERAHALGVPLVTTCYAGSSPATIADAARHATAYLYLVTSSRTGAGPPDRARLKPVIDMLRERTAVPIATGFGIKTRADVQEVLAAGSDHAIVGSACVAALEGAADPALAVRALVASLT
jgi:tryptophan synthase alpha chain